jgi:hypothetical protein
MFFAHWSAINSGLCVGWANVSSAHRILVMIAKKNIHLDLHRNPVGKANHFAHYG